jgi:hypothetical protein
MESAKKHGWTDGEQEQNPITHWQSPFCCLLTILSVPLSNVCLCCAWESTGLDARRVLIELWVYLDRLSLSAGINLISSSLQTNPPRRGLNMKWRLLIYSQKSARLHTLFLSLSQHIDSTRGPDWVRTACAWRLLSWVICIDSSRCFI